MLEKWLISMCYWLIKLINWLLNEFQVKKDDGQLGWLITDGEWQTKRIFWSKTKKIIVKSDSNVYVVRL